MREHADITVSASSSSEGEGLAPGRASRTARLHRRAVGSVTADADARLAAASGSVGAPLPDDARARFEASLGADLSAVRVHTGPASADAAEGLGARAFADGRDIHFGAGQYQPDDPYGFHLLAHEVAHTAQAGAGPRTKLAVSSPGDAAEVEADRAADAMVRGEPVALTSAPATLHRSLGSTIAQGMHSTVEGIQHAQAASGHPLLAPGASGPAVERLQGLLGVAVTGHFDGATRAAVVAFQRQRGLTIDGVVGPQTWRALEARSPQGMQSPGI